MSQIPILKPKEVVRILIKIGFIERRQTGSHLILVRIQDGRKITIPMHSKTLGKGLTHAIIKQVGMTVKEFKKL